MIKAAIIIERADVSLGGAERSVFELAARLRTAGVEATMLAAKGNTDYPDVRILCANRPGKRTPFGLFAQAVKTHLRINPYDVIHSTLPFDFVDIYQPRGGSYAEAVLRNIASYDNIGVRHCKAVTAVFNFRRLALLKAEKRLCTPTGKTVVCALSDYVKAQFVKHYNLAEERIVVIGNGVNTQVQIDADSAEKLRREILDRLNFSEKDECALFLFAANNFRLKGLSSLVRALARVSSNTPPRPVAVVVAGNGRCAGYRRLAEKLGVGDRIIFIGSLERIHEAVSVVDAAVLPTYYDPCSRFILEALAQAKPVITTRFNGAAERIVDNRHGRIIEDPRDIESLAQALQHLAEPQNMQNAAEAIIKDNLAEEISIAKHAETMVELYNRIMADKGIAR
ncbi:MAG: glycosyltransferase family 4 protein [Planctomycetes bacterium]|nr:glycosyltransferase family 4 protein [Planctomycetota bacterium]